MANCEEAVVGVPVIIEPIQIEVALRTVLVQVEHVAIAIDLRNGALYEKPPVPLLLDIFTKAVSY